MPETIDLNGYIDLHSHTNESDGSLTPAELIEAAAALNLSALAISDHDTFSGYRKAFPVAREHNLKLICGIELNTDLVWPDADVRRNLHLLAYFPASGPSAPFEDWIVEQQISRRDRNRRLAAALQERNVDITLEEVEARGRSLTGRPHFARVLVEKSYALNFEDAFIKYLGEDADSFVDREMYTAEEAIAEVRRGGGVPVVAHPIRLSLSDGTLERKIFAHLKEAGLLGLEVIHSDQSAELQHHYRQIADELKLAYSGGSDFHGSLKPRVYLGRGVDENVRVPVEYLEKLGLSD